MSEVAYALDIAEKPKNDEIKGMNKCRAHVLTLIFNPNSSFQEQFNPSID